MCHGWIDGQIDKYDDAWFLTRFTPRKAQSKWSEKNRKRVAELIADGRVSAAGRAAIDAAKADGRWDAAYAPASTATEPDDLKAALDADPASPRVLRHAHRRQPLRDPLPRRDREEARNARRADRQIRRDVRRAAKRSTNTAYAILTVLVAQPVLPGGEEVVDVSHPVRVSIPILLLMSACSSTPKPVAAVAPAPPPVVVTTVAMPAGASAGMAIPAMLADGSYPTPNRDLSPAAATWHLRAALNVAALACRGPAGDAIAVRYNAAIKAHAPALARAEAQLAAEFRAARRRLARPL